MRSPIAWLYHLDRIHDRIVVRSAGGACVRVVGVLVLCLLFSVQLGAEDSRVPWLTSLDAAKEQARAEDRLLLVEFWADWCPPCLQMDRDVWTDVEVGLLASDFVPLKLNLDDEARLAREYAVQAIPTLLFLDGYGNLLFSYKGGKSTSQVVKILRAMPSDIGALHDQISRVEERPEDLVERIRLADLYREMGAFRISNAHFRKAAHSPDAKANARTADRILTTIALNLLDLRSYAEARKKLERCLKQHPDSEFRPLHLAGLVESYSALDKSRKARERLALLESEFPDHPATLTARSLSQQ